MFFPEARRGSPTQWPWAGGTPAFRKARATSSESWLRGGWGPREERNPRLSSEELKPATGSTAKSAACCGSHAGALCAEAWAGGGRGRGGQLPCPVLSAIIMSPWPALQVNSVPVCQPQRGRPGRLLVWKRRPWAPGEAGLCWGGDCRGRSAERQPGGPASSGRRLWGTRTPFVSPGPACPWPQTARCRFTQRRSPWSSSGRGLELGEVAHGGCRRAVRSRASGLAGSAGPSPPCGCPGRLPGPAAPCGH